MTGAPKPWWASRTIWANVVGLGAIVGARYGLELTEAAQAEVVAAVMALINIALRFVTDSPVTVRRKAK